jgi:predicted AAA+ superfamily ATPase
MNSDAPSIPRAIAHGIQQALLDTPVIFIQGPRQCGKSTLALQLRDLGFDANYLTFDDSAVLDAARGDLDGFVAGLAPRVILDEVQRVPDLFRVIKASVDRNRRPGRFLLTGSAKALLLPQVSESLTGRMEVFTLWPLSQGEFRGDTKTFPDFCFAEPFDPPPIAVEPWPDMAERILRGGFPEAAARKQATRRDAWFDAYVTTILERDVRELANVAGLRDLPLLLRLAASRVSGLLNMADLARDAAMAQTTLSRYWTLLEAVFLLQTLPAWSSNLGKRLVKAPKVTFCDSGLLCHLLGLNSARILADDPAVGPVLEAFIGGELTRQLGWSGCGARLFHFGSHARHEVDFVMEDAAGRIVGIEVKKTASPSSKDFSGLRELQTLAGPRFVRGIMLCGVRQTVPFGEKLHAMPWNALWQW